MKFLLNFTMALVFIGFSNSYAQNESEKNVDLIANKEIKTDGNSENIQKVLNEKLSKSNSRNIKINEFNPIKNKNGFITLIEFNDLNCKECLLSAEKTYEAIPKEDLSSLRIIYKHAQKNHIELVNKLAFWGFVAKDCDKFWDFKDKVTQNEYKKDEDIINEFINWGINQKDIFDKLNLRGFDFYKYIDIDTQYAETVKGHTIPMFFIDGYKVDEDISLQEMLEYIKLKKIEWLKKKENLESKYKIGKI